MMTAAANRKRTLTLMGREQWCNGAMVQWCNGVLGNGPVDPKAETCPRCGPQLTSPFNYYVVGGGSVAILVVPAVVGLFAKRNNGRTSPA
jgi:hypothetical protein